MLAADRPEASGALADSPWSMPAFFVGWIGLIAASRAVNTRRAARPLVLAPGSDHGGDLDVLVLLPGMPALAAGRFGTRRGRTLVLHAIDESSRASVRW